MHKIIAHTVQPSLVASGRSVPPSAGCLSRPLWISALGGGVWVEQHHIPREIYFCGAPVAVCIPTRMSKAGTGASLSLPSTPPISTSMNSTASDGLYGRVYQPPKMERGFDTESASSSCDEQRDLNTRLADDLLAYMAASNSVSKRTAHDITDSARPSKRRRGVPPPSSSSMISGAGGWCSSSHDSSGSSIEDYAERVEDELSNKRKFSTVGKHISSDSRFKKRWKQYTRARLATLKKNRAKEISDVVARAHDQRVKSFETNYKHTLGQYRDSARSICNDGSNGGAPCVQPSLPRQGWSRIEVSRIYFAAASRALKAAERRQRSARLAEQSFLGAARSLIAARRDAEENLRLALVQAHPYYDLVRWRLERDLRQSIADTSEIVLLSTTRLLSRASITAVANAKVDLFTQEKLAARLNRERQVCRVNGAGGDSAPRLRFALVKCDRNLSVPLPRRTSALLPARHSVPDSWVSPRLHVVFSQLRAIDTAAAKIASKAQRERT